MNIHELPTLKIDLKDNYVVEAVCKQLDDLILSFEIYNSYIPIDLSSFYIELRALKSDKVPVIQDTDIVITNNKLKIKCNPQLTTSSGIVKAELECIDKITKEKKFSFDIEIEVKPSVLEVNRSISTPTCTLMERLEKDLDKVRDLEFNFNEADKINKELKDTTIPNANKINTTLEENTKKAITSNANLKDSTNTADTAKQAVDSSVVQANASKQALDISKVNADNTKKEVDNSIKIADEKIEIIKNLDPENVVEDVKNLKKQVLESTYTKIETDSTLTKLESCKDSFVHNMQIKGRTLQNLVPIASVNWDITNKRLLKNIKDNICKDNTSYSFVNVSSNKVFVDLYFNNDTYSRSIGIEALSKQVITLKNERIFLVWGRESDGWANTDSDKTKLNTSLMILEGDWTNKEIPQYFEGIKSVGEAEGNKISILTKGKNLFDINSRTYSSSGKIKNIINNTITLEQSADNKRMAFVAFYLKLKPNTSYSLSGKLLSDNTCLRIYNLDDDTSYCILESTGNVTFHTNNDTELQLLLYTAWTSNENKGKIATFETIQVEEGTTTTTYEPYKEDKTEILLPSPHMGIPSGVSDVIDYEKNERIKNIGKALFVGSDSENWSMRTDTNANKDSIMFINPLNVNSGDSVICNRFVNNNNLWNEETEGIQSTISQRDIRIRISKSKLETQDVAGFKKWLQANPTTVYYQLAEPKTEKLNIKDTLQSFENGYIMLDNAITPTAQLEYSTNIPSALGGLTQITDKLVDDVTNVEITISDMDAEIG
ncbi:hypothetical protein FDA09_16505, partial [Clostridium botulinum]|nr:hypothetical protein [Clostridium botulinum]NFO85955.1 hypothetical protein [Clostridium botulinum]NFV62273.1 hypothetical protein [Clostridium botulinum]